MFSQLEDVHSIIKKEQLNYLNLGCGGRFHKDWINVDFVSNSENVVAHNLCNGIPYPDSIFDVVYHSHLLEHFSKEDGEKLLNECFRVLKPGGIIRIVVPDLENIARLYLKALEEIRNGSQIWELNYDWILIELYDQIVRNVSGGDAIRYLSKPEIANKEFILSRWGTEAERIIQKSKFKDKKGESRKLDYPRFLANFIKGLLIFLISPRNWREILIKSLLRDEYSALQLGRFRKSGEVHQWMYDCHSLFRLLDKLGMMDITLRKPTESQIDRWSEFKLDAESEENIYRPDSLYIEATKPCQ